MLRFGANVTAFDVVNYFHRNLDNILVGRIWGSEALGLYSRAYALLMFPVHAIRGPITAVAFPAMSKLQADNEAFKAYYRRTVSIVSLFSMPLCAFILIWSDSIVNILLGEKWLGIVPIFSALALAAFIQPAAGLRGLVLMALGKGGRYFKWGLIHAAVASVAFLVGIHWGPLGVAIAYAIATYGILQPSLLFVFAGTPVRPVDFWQSIARPAAASLLASTLSYFLVTSLADIGSLPIHLMIAFIIFSFLFVGLFCCLPGGIREIVSLFRAFRTLAETPDSPSNSGRRND